MAVDTTLIRGAYRANAPMGAPGAKLATDIAKSITDPVKAYMQVKAAEHTVRNEEWDKYAEDVLNNSDLVGDQYEALYDDIMAGKSDFAGADKKTRDLMKRNLTSMASDYEDYKKLREDVAINLEDYSPAFTNSETGKAYLDILKGGGKKLIRKDGRIGIEVNGEFKSISTIRQELDKNKIDQTSIEALESYRVVARDSTKPFSYENTKTDIMNNLISKGSYNSLKNDEIIPGRIFRKDLAESLMTQKYSDLGITDDDFEGVDGVNASDGISVEEADNIIAHLEKDQGQMKEIMADYYTNYIEQNSSNVIDPAKNGGMTKQQVINLQQDLIQEGFDLTADGVYGPKTIEALRRSNSGEGPQQTTETPAVDEDNVYDPDNDLTQEERELEERKRRFFESRI
tara:strand:+ start:2126 stop:3325 length:1200 start_codon:yes stop_codon:yes gene_type:complete